MKKYLSKAFVILLVSLFTINVFVACVSQSDNLSESLPDSSEISMENQPENNVYLDTFFDNGEDIADYSIVISETADNTTTYGATILQKRFKQATGKNVSIITDATKETRLEIILGKTQRRECLGIDYDVLGNESYLVKNVGKDLVIAGNARGLLYGIYAYLEALGFRFYTPDTERIPGFEDVFIPASINLKWTPVFEYREPMYYSTHNAEWAITQRINSDFLRVDLKNNPKYGGYAGYIGGDKWLVHTFQYLLPSSYFSSHPEYFAYDAQSHKRKDSQPCLSNEEVYDIMLSNALNMIRRDPNGKILSISENDVKLYCQCDKCRENYNKYGVSGTFFRYVNRIATDIGEVYPDVYIDTLSYEMLDTMSAKIPENIEMADNVIVRVCPTMCNFHTDGEKCELLAKNEKLVEDWKKICKNVYVYCYPIVWGNSFVSLPNYDVMQYDIRFFAEQGVKGVYAEGYPLPDPEFGELKAYLMAKLLANPYMTDEEYKYHYRDFLEGYYGDAAEYIEEYHERTKEMIMKSEKQNGHLKSRSFGIDENFIFKYDSRTRSYDMTDIDYINGLWESAVYSTYEEQLEHVKKSQIHWTYIELYNTMGKRMLYSDEITKAKLKARNEELYRNIIKYKTTSRGTESKVISTDISDFSTPPTNWL